MRCAISSLVPYRPWGSSPRRTSGILLVAGRKLIRERVRHSIVDGAGATAFTLTLEEPNSSAAGLYEARHGVLARDVWAIAGKPMTPAIDEK